MGIDVRGGAGGGLAQLGEAHPHLEAGNAASDRTHALVRLVLRLPRTGEGGKEREREKGREVNDGGREVRHI